MVVFINGSFGIGKTTVSRLLVAQLPGSLVFDPEPLGLVLMHLAALGRRQQDDFQDLAAWRWLGARAIRIARRFRSTVIVPMAFTNLAYLGEFLAYLRERGIPTLHFCLTAPHSVVLERLHARQRKGPTAWQLRRSAECCAAHRASEYAEHVPTADRTPDDIANDLARRIRGAAHSQ
jgi:dephospho-CoA kinase